jgi:hypothetical protein
MPAIPDSLASLIASWLWLIALSLQVGRGAPWPVVLVFMVVTGLMFARAWRHMQDAS